MFYLNGMANHPHVKPEVKQKSAKKLEELKQKMRENEGNARQMLEDLGIPPNTSMFYVKQILGE